ncbi:MAG: RNA polymerase sigma factor [Eubacteriales bacterium]
MNKQDCGFIYTQYCDKVFGFVRSKIFNQAEAEDIVQTVFLKVYGNLDKYDETKASLSTWIYTITRNTVYDYLKEKRDHPVLELIDNTVDPAEEPDDSILNNEALEELASALEKLPQKERDVIILIYYQGKPKTEVAKILDITYGQLRYLHDKALSRLKEML